MHGFLSIHGLKSIGYVQVIVSPSYTRARARHSPKHMNPAAATAVAIAVVVLFAAFAIPHLSVSPITLRSSAK